MTGLINGQVKKCYWRRRSVRVTPVMRLGTLASLTVVLQRIGLSGRLNTTFIGRMNFMQAMRIPWVDRVRNQWFGSAIS